MVAELSFEAGHFTHILLSSVRQSMSSRQGTRVDGVALIAYELHLILSHMQSHVETAERPSDKSALRREKARSLIGSSLRVLHRSSAEVSSPDLKSTAR